MPAPELNVSYVAQLARLDLSAEEIGRFQAQLGQIIEYVDALGRVDVRGVEPTAHASLVYNVFRADEPRPSFPVSVALSNAPREANDLFIVTKVVE